MCGHAPHKQRRARLDDAEEKLDEVYKKAIPGLSIYERTVN
jgi:hypothetical protein